MFCPKCGSSQNDELKFCTLCGANLFAVRQVVDNREAVEKFDWSRTWVAEMFMSPDEKKRRKEEMERQRGITPEMKRCNEIKAGVITTLKALNYSLKDRISDHNPLIADLPLAEKSAPKP